MSSNLSEFALLLALHLASMLTPGLNAGAVISNTQAGGVRAGYNTAGFLSFGAFTLSTLSVLALSSLLLDDTVRLVMALLSVGILVYFSAKVIRKLLSPPPMGAADRVLGGRELFWIYVLNPQSIVFFTVLIFSTGIKFDTISSVSVILFITANTFFYYSLLAKFSELAMKKLNDWVVEIATNAMLLVFLLIALAKTAMSIWNGTV